MTNFSVSYQSRGYVLVWFHIIREGLLKTRRRETDENCQADNPRRSTTVQGTN
jgi:hypothetical protein